MTKALYMYVSLCYEYIFVLSCLDGSDSSKLCNVFTNQFKYTCMFQDCFVMFQDCFVN